MKDFEILTNITTHENCRVCGHSPLEQIMSLGFQYLINFLESPNEKLSAAPLELVLCNEKNGGCGLLQLKHTVPGELLFRKFWYKSGVNATMKKELSDIVSVTEKLVDLKSNDIVLDIGANDGTLLRFYTIKGLKLVGFEPATNLMEEAKIGITTMINDFFNYEKFKEEFGAEKAKVITSVSMFYDLEEPNKFVRDIVKILDKNGVWIIQMNYLMTMIENNAFDNIVHEHLEYYSLKSLEYLINKHGLAIFDVELNEINGGSCRVYVKHRDCDKYPITTRLKKLREKEELAGLNNPETYHLFANRIKELKNKTVDFIKKEVQKGKKVYVYGASTRGNTLLQFYEMNNNLIKSAVDRNPMKWGKKIVGTDIPIISEEQGRNENPEYFLVLPWYFINEFKVREREYLEKGGKFIVPLPNFYMVDRKEN